MRVAVLLIDGGRTFDVAAALEVFAADRSERDVPMNEVWCVAAGRQVVLEYGMRVSAQPLASMSDADVVLVPGSSDLPALLETMERPDGVSACQAVAAAHDGGAVVASMCTGAFVLAAAGLLDGGPATTHWSACELLGRRHPRVQVEHNVLHTRDHTGTVWTSAGVTAGVDLCLALLADAHGAAAAATVARSMVLPIARRGGQAQYVPARRRPTEQVDAEFDRVRDAVRADICAPWTLARMARVAHMAPRTFQRRFAVETGTSPTKWLLAEGIGVARQLLETTQLGIEHVAHRSGFAGADLLRKHFATHLGTSPGRYREAFAVGTVVEGRDRVERRDRGTSAFACQPSSAMAGRSGLGSSEHHHVPIRAGTR